MPCDQVQPAHHDVVDMPCNMSRELSRHLCKAVCVRQHLRLRTRTGRSRLGRLGTEPGSHRCSALHAVTVQRMQGLTNSDQFVTECLAGVSQPANANLRELAEERCAAKRWHADVRRDEPPARLELLMSIACGSLGAEADRCICRWIVVPMLTNSPCKRSADHQRILGQPILHTDKTTSGMCQQLTKYQ